MEDAVTSEPSDVNISSINTTSTEPSTRSPTGHVSAVHPVIVRVILLGVLAVFNLGGNGFTLVTIRLTPRLWTKTNCILASMLVANVLAGVFVFWYAPFLVVVFVFNHPCGYNVVVTALTPLVKMMPFVSIYHLILISIERYVAIVHPLNYETTFTDRTLKWSIAATWVIGVLVAMTFSLWLIDADLRKCDPIPVPYHLVDVVAVYLPVCICMFFVYGRILVVWWDQRRRIGPINVGGQGPGTSGQATSGNSSSAIRSEDKPPASTGPASEPAVTRAGDASADVVAVVDQQRQQRQQIKSRRREFKAVYLIAAIVGTFVLLWFPHVLHRVLAAVDCDPVIVGYVRVASGGIGTFNFAFSWVIYAAVSRSYRRAYRQVLVRIGCCGCSNITLQSNNSLIV